MHASFQLQIVRLNASKFPALLVSSVCESLLKKLKGPGNNDSNERERQPTIAIPYVHRISHNLKKALSKYSVNVVFTAPCKLSKVCSMMSKRKSKKCEKKHDTTFTECDTNVVYKIPLSCDKVYIGQTGRCFNERAREHALSVKNNSGGHLAEHCKRCGCTPEFARTSFLKRALDRTEREIVEAYYILKTGDNCISTPSITLMSNEVTFLEGHV